MSVKIKVAAAEELEERQRAEDEHSFFAGATELYYMPAEDVLVLRMQSGVVVQIPRRFVDEIADAAKVILQQHLTLGVGGDVISVRPLDVDISIAGLLRDVLGFNIQRLGGLAKTEAKAHAARANGAKGGRPKGAGSRMRGLEERRIDVPVKHEELFIAPRVAKENNVGQWPGEEIIRITLSSEQVDVDRNRVIDGESVIFEKIVHAVRDEVIEERDNSLDPERPSKA